MQYQGNKKLPIIIGIVVVILFGFGLYFQFRDKNSASKNTTSEYHDPLSGETVYSPPSKTPETYDSDAAEPTYLGFSRLLDTGTTQTQIESIKQAITNFSQANNLGATEVSIKVDEIAPIQNDTEQGLDFPIRVNRKTDFSISVRYLSLDGVSLKASTNGKQVFATTVDPSAQDGDEAVD